MDNYKGRRDILLGNPSLLTFVNFQYLNFDTRSTSTSIECFFESSEGKRFRRNQGVWTKDHHTGLSMMILYSLINRIRTIHLLKRE